MASVRFSARLFAVSATILLALTACTYVGQGAYEEKLHSLDEDNDGCTKGAVSKEEKALGLDRGDCNDNNEFECGLFDEVPYDGWDNDCGDDGFDLVDQDGDGYPGISRADWEALNTDERRAQWPPDVVEDEVDCIDDVSIHPEAAKINPAEIDVPYDGIDSDCAGDNDFDDDTDGYMPDEDEVLKDHPDQLTVGEAYRQYIEEWGYDHLPDPDDPANYGDCNDNNFNENPGFGPEEDKWYDGIDKNCDGLNDFDQDQDGQMPPEDDLIDPDDSSSPTFGLAYSNFIGKYYGNSEPDWDEVWGDCLDKPDTANFPTLDPASVYLGAPDTPYDGVNQDCDQGRNDFDLDADGYRDAATNESLYADYVASWSAMFGSGQPSSTETGDCLDSDATVFPGTLENLGDLIDQDCDGGVDTTIFGFGNLLWDQPRRPVVGKSSQHYVLTTVTDLLDKQVTQHPDVGVTLLFDKASPGFDEPYANQPIFWQGTGTPYPLGQGVDMVTDEAGGLVYPATSYYRQSNQNTYLIIRQLKWNAGTSIYDQQLAYNGINEGDEYLDLDLVRASNNDYWVFSCGLQTLHFFTASASTGVWRQEDAAFLPDNAAGSVCFLETDNPTASKGLGTVCNGSSCTSYALDPNATVGQEIVPSATQPWGSENFTYADTRAGWLIATYPTTGVKVHNLSTGTNYDLLTTDTVHAADMMMLGSDMYLAAIIDGTGGGGRDVVLLYGDPTGTLSSATFAFKENTTRDLEAEGVSLYVDSNRVFIAVSGPDTNGTANNSAVGWVFLGTP